MADTGGDRSAREARPDRRVWSGESLGGINGVAWPWGGPETFPRDNVMGRGDAMGKTMGMLAWLRFRLAVGACVCFDLVMNAMTWQQRDLRVYASSRKMWALT